jgi:PAS domain S-box-containing protein
VTEYYLEGTPCENVVKQSACTLRSCVRELFPNDRLLADLGVEGYVGRPLISVSGKVIGLMVLMSRHAIHDTERAEMVMDIFAGRASAEFERRQHEVELKKSELLFRQVTDNIAPMVYVATPGLDEFHYVSRPFATMWGMQPELLIQEPGLWFGGIHPDDLANMRACAKQSIENDTHVCEFRVVHASTGNAKWLRDRGWKICPAVGEPRVVGIVEDISLERQTLEHLEQARQMAEEASTAKTLFLANISHGIHTASA